MGMTGDAFQGERLRLARVARGLTLDQLGAEVCATRQYLNQLEQEAKGPTSEMADDLAAALGVSRAFFARSTRDGVRPEQCHFRKQRTTPVSIVAQVLARGTILDSFVSRLDEELELPRVSFPYIAACSSTEVEEAADEVRRQWGLGSGPVASMMRAIENAGAVVAFFSGVSERVDALSIDRRRPLVVRNEAKPTACRLRFDLAHETGHLVMHKGVQTGDRYTEEQANRFASAFLLPRAAFIHEFPRGRHLNWTGIFSMKLRWKVSAAAIVRRAYDLGLITPERYRTAQIHLTKTGQRKVERLDDEIPREEPELMAAAIRALDVSCPGSVRRLAEEVGLGDAMFANVVGAELPRETPARPSLRLVKA